MAKRPGTKQHGVFGSFMQGCTQSVMVTYISSSPRQLRMGCAKTWPLLLRMRLKVWPQAPPSSWRLYTALQNPARLASVITAMFTPPRCFIMFFTLVSPALDDVVAASAFLAPIDTVHFDGPFLTSWHWRPWCVAVHSHRYLRLG